MFGKVTVLSLVVSMVLVLAITTGTPASAAACGAPTIVTLYAGQTIDAGTVTVSNDQDFLYVTYSGANDWLLKETHLHIAASLAEIPQTKKGNPKVGGFDYQWSYATPVQEDTYVVSLADLGYTADGVTELVIAAHAVVVQLDANGNEIANETGWGDGFDFPGNSWAMYFAYTLQSCQTGGDDGVLWRTQTQGGWGTVARGGNPGAFRDANFDAYFPNGLDIGAAALGIGGPSVHLSSPGAIEYFLPQGGTAAVLDPSSPSGTDPSSTSAGVLAGQATALTLNVVFDQPGLDGDSPIPLGDLVVVPGSGTACDGMTVQQVLDATNTVLAGNTSQFTPAEVNECASRINENFVDGETNEGYLMTP